MIHVVMLDFRHHRGPIILPLTPNPALTTALATFNARLRDWGYEEDRVAFRACLEEEWGAAQKAGDGDLWIGQREAWIRESDVLLDDIEQFLGSGMLEILSHTACSRLWASITSAVFKVQWQVAVLEVFLDVCASKDVP